MLGKTILLVTRDKSANRRLAAGLRGAGNEVLHAQAADSAAALIEARAVDLVLIDADTDRATSVLDAAQGRVPAVVLSSDASPSVLLELVCTRGVEHVLSRPGETLDDLTREAVITAEKILRAELFGVDKYLPGFGVEMSSATVRGASDRDDVVECITDHVEWLGAGREAARAVAAVVDELITNAVYDAPRDDGGRPRYAHVSRREKVELDPWEHVAVRWGSDGETLAISVTDSFGALRAETVREGLRRCLTDGDQISQKAGGAGIGMYTVLSYSSQLVINVERGVRTEIIALIDLRRKAHGARRGGQSLHLFFDQAEPAEAADAVPAPVQMSDSMRVELIAALAPTKRKIEIVPLVRKPRASESMTIVAEAPTPEPIVEGDLGAGTVCGLLRGASDIDGVVQLGLRFLAHHYEAAVAYRVESKQLRAVHAAGHVHDWQKVRDVALPRDGHSTIATLAAGSTTAKFRPTHAADYRLSKLASGANEAAGLVMPVSMSGEPSWVLVGYGARGGIELTLDELEPVRQELESHLGRVDPDEPWIEVSGGVA